MREAAWQKRGMDGRREAERAGGCSKHMVDGVGHGDGRAQRSHDRTGCDALAQHRYRAWTHTEPSPRTAQLACRGGPRAGWAGSAGTAHRSPGGRHMGAA